MKKSLLFLIIMLQFCILLKIETKLSMQVVDIILIIMYGTLGVITLFKEK